MWIVVRGNPQGQWNNKKEGTWISDTAIESYQLSLPAQISLKQFFLKLFFFFFLPASYLFPNLCTFVKMSCEIFRKCRCSVFLERVLEKRLNSVAVKGCSVNTCFITWMKFMCQICKNGEKSEIPPHLRLIPMIPKKHDSINLTFWT